MALIPGTLPNDTCYGTPQDLLELFAQYLDVPAFALSSKVVFATASTGLTADVIWFNTGVAPGSTSNPILSIFSSGWVDYIKNYTKNASSVPPIASGDFILFQDVSDSDNIKKTLVSGIAALAVPAAGSVTFPMLSTSATEADNVAKRTAKAWARFTTTGTTVTVDSSFGISSITCSVAGTYTLNFSVAQANTNYVIITPNNSETGEGGGFSGTHANISILSRSTSNFGIYVVGYAGVTGNSRSDAVVFSL